MLTHWIKELMNLLTGNPIYVHYSLMAQLRFVLLLLLFLAIPIALLFFV